MKIGVLTSSRADFGIYLPLLKAMKVDPFFELEIIAFGTHLSKYHGFTIDEIKLQGFEIKHQVSSLLITDDPGSISTGYALTAMHFAELWNRVSNEYDWIFCLGDRFEMAAAVVAGIPFNLPIAHLYGGETTLGAIDNVFRHSMSLVAKLHFVSLKEYADRISQIADNSNNIFVIGSLSLENLLKIELLTKIEFKKKWEIDLTIPSFLVTIHPETINFINNALYAQEAFKALKYLSNDHQLIVTSPNADTSGTIYREMFIKLKDLNPGRVHLIENFGTQSYFTCMKFVDLVIGNSSSGIVEAASFNKYVINIGDRQKGRISGKNVLNCKFDFHEIKSKVKIALNLGDFEENNIYFKENASQTIIDILKNTK